MNKQIVGWLLLAASSTATLSRISKAPTHCSGMQSLQSPPALNGSIALGEVLARE